MEYGTLDKQKRKGSSPGGWQYDTPAPGLDGKDNLSAVLEWTGLFCADSLKKKDVNCFERIDIGRR